MSDTHPHNGDNFYPIATGTYVTSTGDEYPTASTYDEILLVITCGNILELTPELEAWLYHGQVAIILNEIGVLE